LGSVVVSGFAIVNEVDSCKRADVFEAVGNTGKLASG